MPLHILDARQCRTARAWLDWTQIELSERSGIALAVIGTFEQDAGTPRISTLVRLRQTFEAAGIRFADAGLMLGVDDAAARASDAGGSRIDSASDETGSGIDRTEERPARSLRPRRPSWRELNRLKRKTDRR